MSKEKRLGRGLEALLGRSPGEAPRENHVAEHPALRVADVDGAADAGNAGAAGQLTVGVHDIERNPFQPRREFDEQEIASLADSLSEHGLLQLLLVRKVGERYQLIAGERRLRAAIKAGWTEVPVQVREADDRQMAELAIVENLQRKDLNPLEKAASFDRYLEEYQCTQEELAGRLSIDRSTIANLIRLLELPKSVQDAIRAGTVSQGHARALLPLGDEREQVAFCDRIKKEGLSVRAVEQLVQEQIHSAEQGEPSAGKPQRAHAATSNWPRSSKSCAKRWERKSRFAKRPRAAAGSSFNSPAPKNSIACAPISPANRCR